MKWIACLALPMVATLATPTAASTAAPGPSRPSLTAADVSVVEGDVAEVVITLSEPAAGFVFAEYRLGGRSAKAGLDFIESSGLILFSPGQTQVVLAIQTFDDLLVEGNEVFAVHLHGTGVSTGGGGPARVTIVDANP